MGTQFVATQSFDPKAMRQTLNGIDTVLHCHHYMTLFTQLADDAKLLKGQQLMQEAAEETFYSVLKAYFDKNQVSAPADRVAIAEQYFAFVGLGQVKLEIAAAGGSAEMKHSHIDEGWIRKWGPRQKNVNFIGHGFLAAAAAAVQGLKPGSFSVQETQSIVSGGNSSKFTLTQKS